MPNPLSRDELKHRITQAAGKPTVADEAALLVTGARRDHYGDPVENHARIGKVWAVLLDLPDPIPPRTVAVMMAALKLVREGGPRGKRDNLVDACGYLLIAEQATDVEVTETEDA